MASTRPVALVNGASRRQGIGAAVALALARDGWDVATTFWRAYDARAHGSDSGDVARLREQLEACGAKTIAVEADLSEVASAGYVFDEVERAVGPVNGLVLSHCESIESDLLDTTVESFDRHFAVNARGSWLLVRELGRRFRGVPGRGRIVALTSDHVAGNVPHGASKGALDRIVLAAAREFAGRGITANVVNPAPTDTGWMTEAQREDFKRRSAQGRLGQPGDCASVVRFLCSAEGGGWVNGQIIASDGGFA